MTRAALDAFLYILDEAFAGDDWHSLMSNLKSVGIDDWLWIPPGGGRPIAEMVAHVAACKNMYWNHAFADGAMTWSDPLANQRFLRSADPVELEAMFRYARDAHERLRSAVDRLGDDGELVRARRTNWGELRETRWIVKATIEHDLYHAGEINRLRALRQSNDIWAYERES